MTQPLQTRRVKEALGRLQELFVRHAGVKLTTLDAAQLAGLDGRSAGTCFGPSPDGFSRAARGGHICPPLVAFSLTVTLETRWQLKPMAKR